MSSPNPIPVARPPVVTPDYSITIFVYFDPESSKEDKLFFSPGPDVVMPDKKSASIKWVGIIPRGSNHSAPTLSATYCRIYPDDVVNDTGKVTPITAGPLGSLIGNVTAASRKSIVTVKICAVSGGAQIMGDTTIRNKGGGMAVSGSAAAAISAVALVAGIALAAFFAFGAALGYYVRTFH
jgi:hypothetical protein